MTLLGTIEHESDVQRSLRIEDCLYSISRTQVKVNAVTDPASQIAQLTFAVDGWLPWSPIVAIRGCGWLGLRVMS